jgi:multidrug efflux system membrane fusion protein
VPAAAVQTGQQGTYVFVVKADQTAELRPVTVARAAGDRFVIASGLKPGETVVTDGHLRLVAGSRVSIKS